MPLFVYTARDKLGKMIQGEQDAPTEATLVRLLQGRELIVTMITLSPSALNTTASRSSRRRRRNRVKAEDLLFFIQQIALLLEVGVPFIRSLELVADQVESQSLFKVLEIVKSDISGGVTFQDAIAKHPKIFPSIWNYLIEAGETGGNLPLVLKRLAQYIEADIGLKKKVVSALVYPAILVIGAIVALLVFMLKLIPVFAHVYESFHSKLPAFTLAVMAVSSFLQRTIIYLAALFAVAIYCLKKYAKTPLGRKTFDAALLNMPLFGGFVRDVIIVRVMITLSALLNSGVNILRSLEICSHVAGNVVFESALTRTIEDIRQGKSFSMALEKSGQFSAMEVGMIMTGEEGGRLSYMVEKVADYYQLNINTFIARLSVLIEPVILVFVGGLIGVIIIAMYLPIFNLGAAIH